MHLAAEHAKPSSSVNPPALILNQALAAFLGFLGLTKGGPHCLRVIQVTWAMHLLEKEA